MEGLHDWLEPRVLLVWSMIASLICCLLELLLLCWFIYGFLLLMAASGGLPLFFLSPVVLSDWLDLMSLQREHLKTIFKDYRFRQVPVSWRLLSCLTMKRDGWKLR